MPQDISYIPLPLLRQILREWCENEFSWSDDEIEVVIDATHNQLRREHRKDFKEFLTRVATYPNLNGTELALDAKTRLEELENND